MYAEPNGTKIAFIDTKNQGYIYSPVTDALILVREIPARYKTSLKKSYKVCVCVIVCVCVLRA